MTELYVLCEHGSAEPHGVTREQMQEALRGTLTQPNFLYPGGLATCPGGRPATVEEVVEWLNAKMADWSTIEGNSTLPVVKVDRGAERRHKDRANWGEP